MILRERLKAYEEMGEGPRPDPEKSEAFSIAQMKAGPEAARFVLSSRYVEIDGQSVYVLEWGNPNGKKHILLHGGPGDSFNSTHVALFNPETDHVVFFDQRGCGESLPSAAEQTKEQIEATNTPIHLAGDIETLRQMYFGEEKANLVGGSWGSTLPLITAMRNPEKIASLRLWSFWPADKRSTLWIFENHLGKANFPETAHRAWSELLELVPAEINQNDPQAMLDFFSSEQGIYNPDPAIAGELARRYRLYEYILCQSPQVRADPEKGYTHHREEIYGDPNTLAASRIELTFMENGNFIPEGFITNPENIAVLKRFGIKLVIVHGKYDWCTPLNRAEEFVALCRQQGVDVTLIVVDAGHLRYDPPLKDGIEKTIAEA